MCSLAHSLWLQFAHAGLLLPPVPPSLPTTIGESPPRPTAFHLAPNFPNPFNASTQISYALAADSAVELRVYNALGQKVRTLVRQYRAAGTYRLNWHGRDDQGRDLSSGTYLLVMRAGGIRQAGKMLLLR